MAYMNTNQTFDRGHSATKTCHRKVCKTCNYLLIGKRQLYPRVRPAPRPRPLSSSVEYAPRDLSEESTNFPETSIEPPVTFILSYTTPSLSQPVLLSSLPAILPSQADPPSSSPVGGDSIPQSTVPSPKIPSLIQTSSDVTWASRKLQTPTVTPTVENTHVGIIVGSVLGGLVAILLGVAVCYCLFRKRRKGRRRKIGYNNLQSEDERPYLLGPEDDDNWNRYPQTDDLSVHNEQDPQEIGRQGRYMSLLQQSKRGVHYPLAGLTPSYRGHNMRFSSVESQSVPLQDHNGSGVRRGGDERLMRQQHDAEPDSRVNDFAERETAEITPGLDARTPSRASILSWARTAFGIASPSVSTGYHPASSRTTMVDVDQISLPRRLQKWKRPLPQRGAG